MKKLFKISLIVSGMLIASSAFSGVAEYENKHATCYIFKSNKQLSKKTNCTHSGYGGSTMYKDISESFNYSEFTIPSYGKVVTENRIQTQNGHDSSEAHLNSEYAVAYYRNKSLQIITESQAENDWENSLECYKSESLNFCYINR